MSRPREYDRTDALNAAMNTFWRYGYERSSYPVLEAAMKMNRGSIYAAFGDKQALFFEALDSYIAERNGRLDAQFADEATPLVPLLRDYFQQIIDYSLGEGEFCGCMLANAAVELGPFDSQANERIWGGFQMTERVLTSRIEVAIARDEIGSDKDPAALAQLIVTTLIGLRVTLRFRNDRKRAERVVNQVLKLFS